MKSNSEIGDDFEKQVGTYYHLFADYVDINRRIRGRSGVIHEIDVYVVKRGIIGIDETAVECKYKNGEDKVTQEEMANFIVKISDVGIKRGDFVTNSYYTSYARLLGNSYRLRLIDGKTWETLRGRIRLRP